MRFFLLSLLLVIILSCKHDDNYESITKDGVFISDHLIPDNHFLGDQKCKECHKSEFKDWHGSDHDRAMMTADSTSVLGNFNNATFNSQGVTSRFFKKGNDYYTNTEGPDGKYHDYKIIYTFGVKPLQQYIVKFPNGHFQCLRTAWDVQKGKWFDLYPDFKIVHSEWLHWSRGGLKWNTMCSDCHSTNVRKNYDEKTNSFDTKFAIINVSCEACHGPGKQHVNDVKQQGSNYKASGYMHMTSKTAPKDLVDQCARCHMRREQFSANYNFQGTMADHYSPQLIETPIYYADGQISDEDYVYGSFIQSKMYQNNVTCSNCHNPHSLKLKFEGNKLCAQCHVPEKYDTPKHHFHQGNGAGTQCINCHMPGKYYMGNDFRRDHSLRIPRPDLSIKYGTPNACVGCHKDKTNEWAWASFKKLYGPIKEAHFSEKLAPGLLREPGADVGLLELINDKKQPEMVRASAVKALAQYQQKERLNNYIALLNDKSPLVRGTTIDILSQINNADYNNYFLPLLNDSKRTVRIKAFYALGGLSIDKVPQEYKANYQKVKKEFDTYLKLNLDFVGGQVKRANYYLKQGNLKKGIEGYEKALKIDTNDNQVRLDLANLYYRNQDFQKVEVAYKTVISQEPKYGPTYYSLGLFYAELNRLDEAITQMQKANSLMPENSRVYYNLSLLYDKNKNPIKAEKILLNGLKVDPNNQSLLYALAFHYSTNGAQEKAKSTITKLIAIDPNNVEYQTFLQSLN